jgi:hypothetical protein
VTIVDEDEAGDGDIEKECGNRKDEVGNFPVPPRWGPRFRIRPRLPVPWLTDPSCAVSAHSSREAIAGSYSNTGSEASSDADTNTNSSCSDSNPDASSQGHDDIEDVTAADIVVPHDRQQPDRKARPTHTQARTDSVVTVATAINTSTLSTPSIDAASGSHTRQNSIAITEISSPTSDAESRRYSEILDIVGGPDSQLGQPVLEFTFSCLDCILGSSGRPQRFRSEVGSDLK